MSTVLLVFGGQQVEVPVAVRRGGVRALEREAERAFSLQPNSFALHDLNGQVDSPEALKRALQEAEEGSCCTMEVREHPEWRALNAAAASVESRILAKVEAALSGLQQDVSRSEKKLDGGLAPLVQCLAMEQMELRTKVASLQSLVPLVQSLTMEQLDTREKLALATSAQAQRTVRDSSAAVQPAPQLLVLCSPPGDQDQVAEPRELPLKGESCQGPSSPSPSTLPPSFEDLEDLERRLRRDLGGQDLGERLGGVEQADEFLFGELQAVRDCAAAAQQDVQRLHAEVQELERKRRDRERPSRREEGQEGQGPASGAKLQAAGMAGLGPDAWLSWNEGLPAGLPYSGKVKVTAPGQLSAHQSGSGSGSGKGKEKEKRERERAAAAAGKSTAAPAAAVATDVEALERPAPFARGTMPLRPVAMARSPGSQSLPLLPPLR